MNRPSGSRDRLVSAEHPVFERSRVEDEARLGVELIQIPDRSTSTIGKRIPLVKSVPILGDRPVRPLGLVRGAIGKLLAQDPVQRGRAGLVEADAEDLWVPPDALVRYAQPS